MKTLIGIVTFGNLPFTQLTIAEILRTTKSPVDILVIIGKPDDAATADWLDSKKDSANLMWLSHETNKGFPASLNDIWDYAWGGGPLALAPALDLYDNVIICGNDVCPYPGAIDALIECAATTDWEWICSRMFDVHTLCQLYPEALKYFTGPQRLFTDFTARPWDAHAATVAATTPGIAPHVFSDVQNLCLFKRSVFERLGYFDANFWPNGYFSDNDFARRAVNANLRGCALAHSVYFHFWSRTVHQEAAARPNNKYFERNARFYRMKWAGDFGRERHGVPFGGRPLMLAPGITLPGSLKIASRQEEGAIVEYWAGL